MRFPLWAIVSLSVLFTLLAALIVYARRTQQQADWFRVFATAAAVSVLLTLPRLIDCQIRVAQSRAAIRRLEDPRFRPKPPRSQKELTQWHAVAADSR